MKNWTINYRGTTTICHECYGNPLTFMLRDYFSKRGLTPMSREWMQRVIFDHSVAVIDGSTIHDVIIGNGTITIKERL